ncbi:MAG: GxxExxY protein [Planctomycetes bacterium]|nr:GxxExxY protein [Planctomycetota bacterium]
MQTKQLNLVTRRIIGCAIEVHRRQGPGLLESVYEEAMCMEMKHDGLAFQRQVSVPVLYRNEKLSAPLKLDLLIAESVVVDLKAVESILPVHEAQLLSYLRMAKKEVGLLINFNVPILKEGIRRKRNTF